jgi:hypothetical protein
MTGSGLAISMRGKLASRRLGDVMRDADAPDINGSVVIENGGTLRAGQFVQTRIRSADDYDLYGRLA